MRSGSCTTTGQWLDKDEPAGHIPKPDLHPAKVLITVWWTMRGVVHYEFLPIGQTINADKYCQEIDLVHQSLSILHPALVNRKGPVLLHGNARPHTAKPTQEKLASVGYEVLPHPPYSPDLSPTDYHLFKHLDVFVRDKQYKTRETLENDVAHYLASRDSSFFAKGINDLVKRWQKCVDANGSYFD